MSILILGRASVQGSIEPVSKPPFIMRGVAKAAAGQLTVAVDSTEIDVKVVEIVSVDTIVVTTDAKSVSVDVTFVNVLIGMEVVPITTVLVAIVVVIVGAVEIPVVEVVVNFVTVDGTLMVLVNVFTVEVNDTVVLVVADL